ncbi:hypothetical protein JTE90_003608 [Oedothorax gibbosus]|uniref:Uncharacterized protein n=1 Tax=Oedothorax gibbosus TaxID=931172 RepID=A0AAV6VBH2_9ARAC|nr:hypothetical protein JTE90_003608 [Oedothorax gibbosus]
MFGGRIPTDWQGKRLHPTVTGWFAFQPRVGAAGRDPLPRVEVFLYWRKFENELLFLSWGFRWRSFDPRRRGMVRG